MSDIYWLNSVKRFEDALDLAIALQVKAKFLDHLDFIVENENAEQWEYDFSNLEVPGGDPLIKFLTGWSKLTPEARRGIVTYARGMKFIL